MNSQHSNTASGFLLIHALLLLHWENMQIYRKVLAQLGIEPRNFLVMRPRHNMTIKENPFYHLCTETLLKPIGYIMFKQKNLIEAKKRIRAKWVVFLQKQKWDERIVKGEGERENNSQRWSARLVPRPLDICIQQQLFDFSVKMTMVHIKTKCVIEWYLY